MLSSNSVSSACTDVLNPFQRVYVEPCRARNNGWSTDTRAVHRSRSAEAPVHFAGAGAGVVKLQQKLRQTKIMKS